jgi:hypothetical protein
MKVPASQIIGLVTSITDAYGMHMLKFEVRGLKQTLFEVQGCLGQCRSGGVFHFAFVVTVG